MSLLHEASALMDRRGPSCVIAILREQHPDLLAEIDELFAAVRDKSIQGSKAGTVLRARFAMKFDDDAVRRHARRICACP